MTDPYAHLADRFTAHYDTVRGAVRHALVARQVAVHRPAPPACVVDVGGGAGHQSLPLARAGYDVTILDRPPRCSGGPPPRHGEPPEVAGDSGC